MTKTIGLKLNNEEIQMINQLKENGLINSDILRLGLKLLYNQSSNLEVNQVNHREVNRVNQYDELTKSIKNLENKLNDFVHKLDDSEKTYSKNLTKGLV